MIPFAFYALKIILCSALLTGYYFGALRNRLFHQWNRFYLLISVVLSLTLPLCTFTFFYSSEQPADAIRILQAVSTTDTFVVQVSGEQPTLSWEDAAAWGYFAVCTVLLLSILYSIIKLFTIISRHRVQQLQRILFLNTSVKGTPFSFLNYLFWNRSIDIHSSAGQQIFRHELTHIRERHTLDKLFMQLILIPFWINPFFWIIRHELRMIHEFIADKKSVNQQDATELATMILQTTYPAYYQQLTNPFFQRTIKRRLLMLTKLQNPKMNYLSRVLALPLLVLVIAAFTLKPVKKSNPQGSNPEVLTLLPVASDTIPVKKIRTEDIAEMNVLSDKRIELKLKDSTVHVYTLAQLREQGLVNDNFSGTKESLANEKRASQISMSGSVDLKGMDSTKRPLIVINGEVYPFDALNSLNPNTIETLNVVKDMWAKARWGEKGKNGAIEVTLKKGVTPPNKKGPFPKSAGSTITFQSDSVSVVKEGNMTIHNPLIETAHEQTFIKTEVPPQFPGGIGAWRVFLEKNLNAEIPVKNGAPNGTYSVTVQFIVEKDGTLSSVQPISQHGYGMEEEVKRLMEKGPKWVPAIQNGHKVRSYHKQVVTVLVTKGDDAATLKSGMNLNIPRLQSLSPAVLIQADAAHQVISGLFSIGPIKEGDITETSFTSINGYEGIKKLISTAKKGDIIAIDRRMGRTVEGKEVKLPSVVYYTQ